MNLPDFTLLNRHSLLKIIERDLWDTIRADEGMTDNTEASSTQESARNVPCLRLQSIEIIQDNHLKSADEFVVGCLTDDRVLSFQINEGTLDRFQVHHIGTVEASLSKLTRHEANSQQESILVRSDRPAFFYIDSEHGQSRLELQYLCED